MSDNQDDAIGSATAQRLRSIVERIERLEEERKNLANDIKDVFQEAKSAGFETGALKEVLKDRRREPAEVEERDMLVDAYRRALGM